MGGFYSKWWGVLLFQPMYTRNRDHLHSRHLFNLCHCLNLPVCIWLIYGSIYPANKLPPNITFHLRHLNCGPWDNKVFVCMTKHCKCILGLNAKLHNFNFGSKHMIHILCTEHFITPWNTIKCLKDLQSPDHCIMSQ